MKQQFFTNSVQSNYIKALIYNTPLPLLNTVNENSYLIEGNKYIYKDRVIQCTRSGILRMPELDAGYEAYYKNGDIQIYKIPESQDVIANLIRKCRIISPADFGHTLLFKLLKSYFRVSGIEITFPASSLAEEVYYERVYRESLVDRAISTDPYFDFQGSYIGPSRELHVLKRTATNTNLWQLGEELTAWLNDIALWFVSKYNLSEGVSVSIPCSETIAVGNRSYPVYEELDYVAVPEALYTVATLGSGTTQLQLQNDSYLIFENPQADQDLARFRLASAYESTETPSPVVNDVLIMPNSYVDEDHYIVTPGVIEDFMLAIDEDEGPIIYDEIFGDVQVLEDELNVDYYGHVCFYRDSNNVLKSGFFYEDGTLHGGVSLYGNVPTTILDATITLNHKFEDYQETYEDIVSTPGSTNIQFIYNRNTDEFIGIYVLSEYIMADPPAGYTLLRGASYRDVEDFTFGRYYPKFTEVHISKYNYYDSATHEYLGRLLRCVRDIFEIDLMPFYNCVSGRYISHLLIEKTGLKSAKTDSFKTFKIPVKFNTTYTIALDCSSNVKIAPALLSNNHVIDDVHVFTTENSVESYNPQAEVSVGNIFNFSSTSFKQPITVGFDIVNLPNSATLSQYENYLYMLIQIPITNKSSLVVLEGDYTKTGVASYYSIEGIDQLSDLQLSNVMLSGLSLLSINDGVIWPYANRLLEYLTYNAITSRDDIDRNIGRVQASFPTSSFIPNVWSNVLRSNIYTNYQRPSFVEQRDLNGFVDKDTEALMHKIKY